MHHSPRAARWLLAAFVALPLLSCGRDDRPGPTQPLPVNAPAAGYTAGDTALANRIANYWIPGLFTDIPRRTQAEQQFQQVQDAWSKGNIAQAREKVDTIIAHTLDQIPQGLIAGLIDNDPLKSSLLFFNDLYTYVGLSTSDQQVDPNTYLALVNPSANDQTFDSGLGEWTVIPGNTLSQSVLLYVQRQPGGADIGTGLPQGSDPYEVHFIPDITLPNPIYIAICAGRHDLPFGSTQLAHAHDGVVDILPSLPNGFVCGSPALGMKDATPSLTVPPRGLLALAGVYARRALSVFGATPAWAGHAATMGSVSTLSPLEVVITGTRVDSLTSTGGVWGDTAKVSAKLVDAGGAALSGQVLSLSVNGLAKGSLTTDANGRVSFTLPGLAVGTYYDTVRFAGVSSPSFVLQPSSAAGSFVIGRKLVTVTASSATVTFGQQVPGCTVVYAGLVSPDQPSSVGTPASTCSYPTTARTSASFIGTKVVAPSAITVTNANYAVQYVSGSFTMNATGPLTLTASSASIVYGQAVPACTVKYAGLVKPDSTAPLASDLVSTCTYPTTVGLNQPVSPSAIVPNAGGASRYVPIGYVSGSFSMVYNSTVGHYFISPLPMRQIQAGSGLPLKFQLFLADGVTPVTTGVFKGYVIAFDTLTSAPPPGAVAKSLGTFSYKSSSKTWELGVSTTGWPLGVVKIFVPLGDGSEIKVLEVIKQ